MKIFIIVIGLISLLNANVNITQNMRALYKDVKLLKVQEDYILDNQYRNIEFFEKILNIEIRKLHRKSINEKNIVRFLITPNGKIKDIRMLKTSNDKKIDKTTKKAIFKTPFIRPSITTELRFIISYQIGNSKKNSIQNKNREVYYQTISRGTTRFQHKTKEYVRIFQTTSDGFINANVRPDRCASLKLLTINNQHVRTGYYSQEFNTEIAKGKYKLLIKTNKLCNVNLQYK